MTVHNHGPEDGPGLACNERRLSDGTLRGACLDAPLRDRLAQLIHLHHCDTRGPNRPRPVGPCWWADRAVADAVLTEVRPLMEQAQPKVPWVLAEVAAERARQDEKWGEQNHPDGTTTMREKYAVEAKVACDVAFKAGRGSWLHILREEFAEASAEEDPTALRRELLQVAAVAVAWVEAIDRRPMPPAGMCTACGSVEVTLRQVTGTRDLSHIGESPEYPTGYGCEMCS